MYWEKAVLELIPTKEVEDDPDLLTLVVGEADKAQSFFLHKTWLELSSVGFKKLLSQNKNSYTLPGLRPDIFDEIVKHIYTFSEWKFNGNLVDACSFLKAALDFQLEELTLKIHKTISKLFLEEVGLARHNACFVFDVVRNASFMDEGKLKNDILIYICKNAKLILTMDSFLNLSLDGLLEILSSDDLEVDSELDVFKAVIRWGINTLEKNGKILSPANLQDTLRKPLKCVRFSNMSMFESEYYIQRMGFVSANQELSSVHSSGHECIEEEQTSYLLRTAEKSSEHPGVSVEVSTQKPRNYCRLVPDCENDLEPAVYATVDILRAELYMSNLKFKSEASVWTAMLSELKDETRRALSLHESDLSEIQKMSSEIVALRKELEMSAVREQAIKETAESAKMAVLTCEWRSFLRLTMDLRLGPNDSVLIVLQNSTDLTLQLGCVDEPANYSEMPPKIAAGTRAQFSVRTRKRPPLQNTTMFSFRSVSHSFVVAVSNICEDEFVVSVHSHLLWKLGNSAWKSDYYNKYLSWFWRDQVKSSKTNSKTGIVATKKFQADLPPTTIRASMAGGILKILIFQD